MSEASKHGIPDGTHRRVSASRAVNGELPYLDVSREGKNSYLTDADGRKWRMRQVSRRRYTLAEVGKPRTITEFRTDGHRAFAEWLAAHALVRDHGAIPMSYTPKGKKRR